MKFSEDTSFALYWVVIIGMVVAACLIMATGCAHKSKKVIMVNCEQSNTTTQEGRLDLCEEY